MKVLLLLLGLAGSAWWMLDLGRGSRAWETSEAQMSYYGNGKPRSRLSYADGRPHGPAEEWYPDGRPAARGEYVEGLREGPWTFWREDGSVDAERSGLYSQGQRVAAVQDRADS